MHKNTNKTRKKGESHANRAEAAGKAPISPFHATIMYIMGAPFKGGPGAAGAEGEGGCLQSRQGKTETHTPKHSHPHIYSGIGKTDIKSPCKEILKGL